MKKPKKSTKETKKKKQTAQEKLRKKVNIRKKGVLGSVRKRQKKMSDLDKALKKGW